jgi:hypothetical protein
MGTIRAHAEKTIIWLGEEDSASQIAIQFMKRLWSHAEGRVAVEGAVTLSYNQPFHDERE